MEKRRAHAEHVLEHQAFEKIFAVVLDRQHRPGAQRFELPRVVALERAQLQDRLARERAEARRRPGDACIGEMFGGSCDEARALRHRRLPREEVQCGLMTRTRGAERNGRSLVRRRLPQLLGERRYVGASHGQRVPRVVQRIGQHAHARQALGTRSPRRPCAPHDSPSSRSRPAAHVEMLSESARREQDALAVTRSVSARPRRLRQSCAARRRADAHRSPALHRHRRRRGAGRARARSTRRQIARTASGECDTKKMVLPLRRNVRDRADALLLEIGVADGEDFVEQQDVGVEVRRNRESQPHVHAGRVVLDRHVHEVLEPGVGRRCRVHRLGVARATARGSRCSDRRSPRRSAPDGSRRRARSSCRCARRARRAAGRWSGDECRRPASERCSCPSRCGRRRRPLRRARSSARSRCSAQNSSSVSRCALVEQPEKPHFQLAGVVVPQDEALREHPRRR